MTIKQCRRCGKYKPTDEFYKKLDNKDGIHSYCKSCCCELGRARRARDPAHVRRLNRESNHRLGIYQPLGTNTKCAPFLGVYVAERVLSHVFESVIRAPINNPGFDFICKRGKKIDVKSATRLKLQPNTWKFHVSKNKTADYFLCLAFDNRESLTPEHVWILPGELVNNQMSISISDSTLNKWAQYELEGKIVEIMSCCDTMRRCEASGVR